MLFSYICTLKLGHWCPIRVSLTLAFWASTILSAEWLSHPFGADFFPNTFLNRPLNLFLKIKQTNEREFTFIRTVCESRLWPFLHTLIATINTAAIESVMETNSNLQI